MKLVDRLPPLPNTPLWTTFDKLYKAGACTARYRRLAKKLGGIRSYGHHTPITLGELFDLSGDEVDTNAAWGLYPWTGGATDVYWALQHGAFNVVDGAFQKKLWEIAREICLHEWFRSVHRQTILKFREFISDVADRYGR